MSVSIQQLEKSEEACHVKGLIKTLTDGGKQFRKWAREYEAGGNHERAAYFHKQADRNLEDVKWWMERQERDGQTH